MAVMGDRRLRRKSRELLELEREPIPVTLVMDPDSTSEQPIPDQPRHPEKWGGRAMKALKLLSLGALSLAMAIVGCAGSGQSDKRLSNADVSLISFGSLHGEVAECG